MENIISEEEKEKIKKHQKNIEKKKTKHKALIIIRVTIRFSIKLIVFIC